MDYFFHILILALVGLCIWNAYRSRFVLEQWAKAHEFEILYRKFRFFDRGPFLSTGMHNVYYVRVRDREGNERSGWFKCGEYWTGDMPGKVEVKWKD